MSGSPRPLRDELRDRYDERVVQRVWQGVVRRRARRATLRRAGWAGAAGLAVAAAVVVLARGTRPPAPPGPLRLAGGGEPAALIAAAAAPETAFALDDGSRVVLGRGARADVVENSGYAFVAVLSEGRATFDVRPGGPRRWSIECGLATVEVVGTRFSIERTTAAVSVSVERGVVLVRGERVPERTRRLGAGQSLRIGEAAAPARASSSASSSASSGASSGAPPDSGAAPPVTVAARRTTATAPAGARHPDGAGWRDLARSHDYQRAYGALGGGGTASWTRTATPEELLWLADVARLSGHPADAVVPLRRLIEAHPRDASVPVALFTLGRIQLDSLGDSRGAADSFSRALAAGVPRTLAEDAAARLVEAHARAGDDAAARAAAARYLDAYPDGRAAADVRRWAAPR